MPRSPDRVISSQTDFWSLDEIQLLFGPFPERELRQKLADYGIAPAGVRPPRGRGRPPLVYDAAKICDIMGDYGMGASTAVS